MELRKVKIQMVENAHVGGYTTPVTKRDVRRGETIICDVFEAELLMKRGFFKVIEELPEEKPTEAVQVSPLEVPDVQVVVPVRRGRGRPRGSKNIPKVEELQPNDVAPQV